MKEDYLLNIIPWVIVIGYWDRWQSNKGKRGFNYIPVDSMREVKSRNGIVLDYIEGFKVVI